MGMNHKSEVKLKVAQSFEAAGDNLHAIQLYNSIIQDDPDFIEAYFALSDLYEKQGNFVSAENLLKGCLEYNPDNNSVRLYLAQFLLRLLNWEDVIDVLSNVQVEEEPLAAFFSGYSYFMMKDYEPAKINFISFTVNGKKTELIYEAYIYLAKIEIQLKNFKSARDYVKKAEVVYSDYWELNLINSIIYYNLGMYAHAVLPVEKAMSLNPGDNSSYEWAGRIYLKSGDYIKAEKYFLKHIDAVENPASDIYASLAEACLRNNKTEDAVLYYDVALKIDPQNIFAAEGKKNALSLLKKQAPDE
jgi:tetratricopeptide (TPR) repeat protein